MNYVYQYYRETKIMVFILNSISIFGWFPHKSLECLDFEPGNFGVFVRSISDTITSGMKTTNSRIKLTFPATWP